MILALILLPAAAGAAALLLRADALRRALLLFAAIAHAGMTALVAFGLLEAKPVSTWLLLDDLGLLFLGITSALFLAVAVYGVGYLSRERGVRRDFEEGWPFSNAPEAVFTGNLLFFLAAMTLVTATHHYGLLWVAIEATTLASAPLVYYHRHHRSLEAAWKYLLLCSVGIALALLGNYLLAVASQPAGAALTVEGLRGAGTGLASPWIRAAFLFFLVGYGTKMGLAPLHTWLPDAHSEAPSVVSALLSGAVLNCAFLGILRAFQACVAAGEAAFARELLVLLGLVSMGIAAAFVLNQADYKRMLAYSSVEHMGILALGVGLGGAAARGALLHALNHSLTKGMLFLVAGNVLRAYSTKVARDVRGVGRVLPASGVLWVAGFLAITGIPPFGPFVSEFTILKGALDGGRTTVATLYLALLALTFVGMATTVLRMVQGAAPGGVPRRPEPWASIAPPAALALAVLTLGLYVPPPLVRMFEAVVGTTLGG
ncbi:MAG: NADH dehydrogenase FAD-containing subunit [Planctomycetes bacterium]|nr:NADH dehydrogenase FAD-containing subunit [Planctomycetota bacterium]